MTENERISSRIKIIVNDLIGSSTGQSLKLIDEIESSMCVPVKRSFLLEDTYDRVKSPDKKSVDMWVVWECKGSGYSIVYDEEKDEFGLSQLGLDGINRFIGVKGNLLYVYEAM